MAKFNIGKALSYVGESGGLTNLGKGIGSAILADDKSEKMSKAKEDYEKKLTVDPVLMSDEEIQEYNTLVDKKDKTPQEMQREIELKEKVSGAGFKPSLPKPALVSKPSEELGTKLLQGTPQGPETPEYKLPEVKIEPTEKQGPEKSSTQLAEEALALSQEAQKKKIDIQASAKKAAEAATKAKKENTGTRIEAMLQTLAENPEAAEMGFGKDELEVLKLKASMENEAMKAGKGGAAAKIKEELYRKLAEPDVSDVERNNLIKVIQTIDDPFKVKALTGLNEQEWNELSDKDKMGRIVFGLIESGDLKEAGSILKESGSVMGAIQGAGLTKEQNIQANKLREDYTTELKQYDKLERDAEKLLSTVSAYNEDLTDEEKAMNDYGLIYMINKLLDENSVVRESEFKNTSGIGDLVTQFKNFIDNYTSGQRLQPLQRRAFGELAERIHRGSLTQKTKKQGKYVDLANNYGINFGYIDPTYKSKTKEVAPVKAEDDVEVLE